jgi:putative FmdB family regulatory protein
MLCAMPIYEYRCATCDERFEELARNPDVAVPCPACGGERVERLLSVFAGVGGSSAPAAPEPSKLGANRPLGGGCGPGCGCHH